MTNAELELRLRRLEGAMKKEHNLVFDEGDLVKPEHGLCYGLRGFIDGYRYVMGTDTEHDISVSAGACRDAANGMSLVSSAIVKQLDATWAKGTNAGGLDTGTLAASSAYFGFVIYNATTKEVDQLFSLSSSAPTLPSGWTLFRRNGSCITDASANIVPFAQWMDEFRPKTPLTSRALAAIPSTSRFAISVDVPAGMLGRFLVEGDNLGSAADYYAWIASANRPDAAPTAANYTMYLRNPADKVSYVIDLLVDASRQIYARGTDVNIALGVKTLGWYDGRGRNE